MQIFDFFKIVYDKVFILQLLSVSFSIVWIFYDWKKEPKNIAIGIAYICGTFLVGTLLNWLLFALSLVWRAVAGIDAIPAYTAPESVAAFEKFGVFTKSELESRVEIEYETYAKTINIEAKAMIDIAGKQIIPAVIKYTTELGQSIATVKSACASADVSAQTDILTETSSLLAETQKALKSLETVTAKGTEMGEGKEQAVYYRDEVKSAMDALRAPVDKLEMIVDKDLWPMPSYGDLIFEV